MELTECASAASAAGKKKSAATHVVEMKRFAFNQVNAVRRVGFAAAFAANIQADVPWTAAARLIVWSATTVAVVQVRSAASRAVAQWAGRFAIITVAIRVRTASTTHVYPAAVAKVRPLAPMGPVTVACIWIGIQTSESIGAALSVETFINARVALDIRFQAG